MLSSLTWSSDEWTNEPSEVNTRISNPLHKKLKAEMYQKSSTSRAHFYSAIDALTDIGVSPSYAHCSVQSTLNWSLFPYSVSAAGGQIPYSRQQRKTYQIENMVNAAYGLIAHLCSQRAQTSQSNNGIQADIVVCEFCAGSGFVALPLCFLFPTVQFVIIDAKAASLEIAKKRIREAGLTNVRVVQGKIEDYDEAFDVGIALHACGGATDVTLQKCLRARAAFVLCPCCIGKILLSRSDPHSDTFKSCMDKELFKKLVQAADFGHPDVGAYQFIDRHRRVCKCFVEEDRLLLAKSQGYQAFMVLMQPAEASPKNDMLIGWPADSDSRFLAFNTDLTGSVPSSSVDAHFTGAVPLSSDHDGVVDKDSSLLCIECENKDKLVNFQFSPSPSSAFTVAPCVCCSGTQGLVKIEADAATPTEVSVDADSGLQARAKVDSVLAYLFRGALVP